MSIIPITKNGYQKLKEKLDQLKEEFNKLPEVIAHARSKGDLKENAEYHAAKEKQGMLNAEINKINSDLVNSKIIDPQTLPKDVITFGKTVILKDKNNNKKINYLLLGPAETQFNQNSLSIKSTLAKAILGKKVNDNVIFSTPAGEKNYTIENILVE